VKIEDIKVGRAYRYNASETLMGALSNLLGMPTLYRVTVVGIGDDSVVCMFANGTDAEVPPESIVCEVSFLERVGSWF